MVVTKAQSGDDNGILETKNSFLRSGVASPRPNPFGDGEGNGEGVKKEQQKENLSFFSNKKRQNFSKASYQQKSSFSRRETSTFPLGNNRFSETQKQQVVSITYEEIGLFPRSFNRVFDRFFKQLFFDVENFVIQEYRFYRYLFLTTVKCLFILLVVPLTVNFLAKNYFIRPITEYFWNTQNHEIFLNSYQQKRAFSEFKNFEEKIYFESFLFSDSSHSFSSKKELNFEKEKKDYARTEISSQIIQKKNGGKENELMPLSPFCTSPQKQKNEMSIYNHFEKNTKSFKDASKMNDICFQKEISFDEQRQNSIFLSQNGNKEKVNLEKTEYNFSKNFQNSLQKRLQTKIVELAKHYNEESIEAVTNFFADILSFATLWFLLVRLEIQINITKSFLLEVFFGLDDSKKSLLILFLTDLLVGYHSPNIWELFFQTLFDHYGLPESQTTIFLLVATLPVLLDVLFKYLIFRHLNRASPATVATYHAMIE